jgi:hypothetical protein
MVQCPVNYAPATAPVTVTGWNNAPDDVLVMLCYNAAAGGSWVCGPETGVTTLGLMTVQPTVPTGGIPSGAFVFIDVIIRNDGSTFWGYSDNGP